MSIDHVYSAVACLILDADSVLLGRRFNCGTFTGWQCPGGYMQVGESFESAARRLAVNKAGIEPGAVSMGPVTNNIFNSQPVHHTVTHYVICRDFKIVNTQQFADSEYDWQWFKIEQIPGERFLPLDILLKHHDIRLL